MRLLLGPQYSADPTRRKTTRSQSLPPACWYFDGFDSHIKRQQAGGYADLSTDSMVRSVMRSLRVFRMESRRDISPFIAQITLDHGQSTTISDFPKSASSVNNERPVD